MNYDAGMEADRRRSNDRLAEVVAAGLREHETECADRQARVDERLKVLKEDVDEIKTSIKWVLTSIIGSLIAFAMMQMLGK